MKLHSIKTWEKKCLPIASVNLLLWSISASHFNYFFPLSSQQQFGIAPGFRQSGMLDRQSKELNYVEFSPTSGNLWLRRIIWASERSEFQVSFSMAVQQAWAGSIALVLAFIWWHVFLPLHTSVSLPVSPVMQAPFHSNTKTTFILIHAVVEAQTRITTSCA